MYPSGERIDVQNLLSSGQGRIDLHHGGAGREILFQFWGVVSMHDVPR